MPEIVSVDTRAMIEMGRRLMRAQRPAYDALQREIRDIGEGTIAAGARERASFSRSIPPTIAARARGLRVVVSAGNADVPIAKWFEEGRAGGGGKWRHPVFPSRKVPRSRWHWVDERDPHRPFLAPALDEAEAEAGGRIADAAAAAVTEYLQGGGQ